jgi:hypothetical protein
VEPSVTPRMPVYDQIVEENADLRRYRSAGDYVVIEVKNSGNKFSISGTLWQVTLKEKLENVPREWWGYKNVLLQ